MHQRKFRGECKGGRRRTNTKGVHDKEHMGGEKVGWKKKAISWYYVWYKMSHKYGIYSLYKVDYRAIKYLYSLILSCSSSFIRHIGYRIQKESSILLTVPPKEQKDVPGQSVGHQQCASIFSNSYRRTRATQPSLTSNNYIHTRAGKRDCWYCCCFCCFQQHTHA